MHKLIKNHRAYIDTWPINFKFIISSIHTLMVISSTNQLDHKGVNINYTILIVDLGRKRSDHFSSLYNFLFCWEISSVQFYVHKKRETGESSYEFQIKCGGPRPSYVPLFRPYIWPAALERQKRGLEPSQPAGPPPHLLPLVQARLQAEGYLRGVLQLQVRAALDLVRRFQKWARVRLKIEMASVFFFSLQILRFLF